MRKKFTCEWITDLYVIIMLGLFPLVITRSGYQTVDVVKYHFFTYTTCIWIICLLICILKDLICRKPISIRFRPIHIVAVVFLLFTIISSLSSSYGFINFFSEGLCDDLLVIFLYVISFLGISFFCVPKRIHLWALGFGLGVCSIICFLQMLGFNPLNLYPGILSYSNMQSFLGTIGNIDFLSTYLCLTVPVLGIYSWKSKNHVDRFLIFPAILGLVILLNCGVSAGVVAILGCAFVSIPFFFHKEKTMKIASVVCVILVLLSATMIYFYPKKSGTIYEMSQVLHGRLDDDFGTGRGQIWKRGITLFLEHPWIGTGPSSSGYRYDIQWYRLTNGTAMSVGDAHNAYLEYLVTIGIFGTLAYIATILCGLVYAITTRKKNSYSLALGIGILCYSMQVFFNSTIYLVAPLMWILLGLLESISIEGGKMNEES